MLDRSIIRFFLKERFRFLAFLVKMWLLNDFEYENLPEAVFLNRLAAARFVFILGIFPSPYRSRLVRWSSIPPNGAN